MPIRAPSLGLALAVTALASGCVGPGLPPPLSVTRFAHLPRSRVPSLGGKVSATAGVVADGQDRVAGDSIAGFDGEGALSLWVGPGYDLTLASSGYMTEAEGNLRLTRGPLRLGLLHGVGLAVAVTGGGPTIFAEANTGLLLQLQLGGGALIVAGRGSYDTVFVDARVNAAAGGPGNLVQPYASVALSVAWDRPVGGLELTPELTLLRRLPVVTANGRPEWVAALLLTVSAPFPGPAGR